jgi:hypothetical protein
MGRSGVLSMELMANIFPEAGDPVLATTLPSSSVWRYKVADLDSAAVLARTCLFPDVDGSSWTKA